MPGIEINHTNQSSMAVGGASQSRTAGGLVFLSCLNGRGENGLVSENQKAAPNSEIDEVSDDRRSKKEPSQRHDRRGATEKEPDSNKIRREREDGHLERTSCNPVIFSNENRIASLDPPARSILHTVDFERIVSSIRIQRSSGLSSVVINLKSSVLDGLELCISLKQGRGLVAEFIAASDSARSAIESRTAVLLQMFADRGVALESLNVSVGSGDRDGTEYPTEKAPLNPMPDIPTANLREPLPESAANMYTGISYLT